MRVLLFDIDGTLLYSNRAGQLAMDAAFREQFGAESPPPVPVHGRTDRGIARDLFSAHGVADSDENWARLRAAYVAHLARRLPERKGWVLPGVRELLDRLQARADTALGLLTGNVREAARHKLEYFELAGYFRFGAFGDEHADRDEVAREALRQWRRRGGRRRDGERIWVIGDTPMDVRCGRAIGAAVAAVATGAFGRSELEAAGPDLLLENLEDSADLRLAFFGPEDRPTQRPADEAGRRRAEAGEGGRGGCAGGSERLH